jgi:hypothetical protein
MSKPDPEQPPIERRPLPIPHPEDGDDSLYYPEDVALRDRAAARGIRIRIPLRDSNWTPPEPIQVEGDLSASEILIRWRHAPP